MKIEIPFPRARGNQSRPNQPTIVLVIYFFYFSRGSMLVVVYNLVLEADG
jgi:hypothetical protein